MSRWSIRNHDGAHAEWWARTNSRAPTESGRAFASYVEEISSQLEKVDFDQRLPTAAAAAAAAASLQHSVPPPPLMLLPAPPPPPPPLLAAAASATVTAATA
jgi:hypothetical protein